MEKQTTDITLIDPIGYLKTVPENVQVTENVVGPDKAEAKVKKGFVVTSEIAGKKGIFICAKDKQEGVYKCTRMKEVVQLEDSTQSGLSETGDKSGKRKGPFAKNVSSDKEKKPKSKSSRWKKSKENSEKKDDGKVEMQGSDVLGFLEPDPPPQHIYYNSSELSESTVKRLLQSKHFANTQVTVFRGPSGTPQYNNLVRSLTQLSRVKHIKDLHSKLLPSKPLQLYKGFTYQALDNKMESQIANLAEKLINYFPTRKIITDVNIFRKPKRIKDFLKKLEIVKGLRRMIELKPEASQLKNRTLLKCIAKEEEYEDSKLVKEDAIQAFVKTDPVTTDEEMKRKEKSAEPNSIQTKSHETNNLKPAISDSTKSVTLDSQPIQQGESKPVSETITRMSDKVKHEDISEDAIPKEAIPKEKFVNNQVSEKLEVKDKPENLIANEKNIRERFVHKFKLNKIQIKKSINKNVGSVSLKSNPDIVGKGSKSNIGKNDEFNVQSLFCNRMKARAAIDASPSMQRLTRKLKADESRNKSKSEFAQLGNAGQQHMLVNLNQKTANAMSQVQPKRFNKENSKSASDKIIMNKKQIRKIINKEPSTFKPSNNVMKPTGKATPTSNPMESTIHLLKVKCIKNGKRNVKTSEPKLSPASASSPSSATQSVNSVILSNPKEKVRPSHVNTRIPIDNLFAPIDKGVAITTKIQDQRGKRKDCSGDVHLNVKSAAPLGNSEPLIKKAVLGVQKEYINGKLVFNKLQLHAIKRNPNWYQSIIQIEESQNNKEHPKVYLSDDLSAEMPGTEKGALSVENLIRVYENKTEKKQISQGHQAQDKVVSKAVASKSTAADLGEKQKKTIKIIDNFPEKMVEDKASLCSERNLKVSSSKMRSEIELKGNMQRSQIEIANITKTYLLNCPDTQPNLKMDKDLKDLICDEANVSKGLCADDLKSTTKRILTTTEVQETTLDDKQPEVVADQKRKGQESFPRHTTNSHVDNVNRLFNSTAINNKFLQLMESIEQLLHAPSKSISQQCDSLSKSLSNRSLVSNFLTKGKRADPDKCHIKDHSLSITSLTIDNIDSHNVRNTDSRHTNSIVPATTPSDPLAVDHLCNQKGISPPERPNALNLSATPKFSNDSILENGKINIKKIENSKLNNSVDLQFNIGAPVSKITLDQQGDINMNLDKNGKENVKQKVDKSNLTNRKVINDKSDTAAENIEKETTDGNLEKLFDSVLLQRKPDMESSSSSLVEQFTRGLPLKDVKSIEKRTTITEESLANKAASEKHVSIKVNVGKDKKLIYTLSKTTLESKVVIDEHTANKHIGKILPKQSPQEAYKSNVKKEEVNVKYLPPSSSTSPNATNNFYQEDELDLINLYKKILFG